MTAATLPASREYEACSNCRHQAGWPWARTCRRVIEVDAVTGKPVEVYERPVKTARLEDCHGRWFIRRYY